MAPIEHESRVAIGMNVNQPTGCGARTVQTVVGVAISAKWMLMMNVWAALASKLKMADGAVAVSLTFNLIYSQQIERVRNS